MNKVQDILKRINSLTNEEFEELLVKVVEIDKDAVEQILSMRFNWIITIPDEDSQDNMKAIK